MPHLAAGAPITLTWQTCWLIISGKAQEKLILLKMAQFNPSVTHDTWQIIQNTTILKLAYLNWMQSFLMLPFTPVLTVVKKVFRDYNVTLISCYRSVFFIFYCIYKSICMYIYIRTYRYTYMCMYIQYVYNIFILCGTIFWQQILWI